MSDNNGNVFQAKIAYLGFIQDVIARMGNHSFLIKGWTITLVTAILSLTKAEKAHFAIAIILLFWWLNAFFLYQEKLYRELYKKVANDDIPSLLFVMDVKEHKLSSDISIYTALKAPTLFIFYLVLIIFVLVFIHYQSIINFLICNICTN